MGSYLFHSYPVGIENFSITLSTLGIPRKVKGLLLVRFFVGVLKHSPKLIWGVGGGKGFVPAYRFILKGTQGRNLESATEAEAMEESCLMACSQVLLSSISYITQDYLPRGGTTHSGPATTIKQQNSL